MVTRLALITDRRGSERKLSLLREFDLVPVLHTRLLAGKVLACCCGEPLTTYYYQFDVQEKGTGRSVFRAYAGSNSGASCASTLIELSAQTPSPIAPIRYFNPLIGGERDTGRDGAGAGRTRSSYIGWHAFNIELFDAINLISLVWDVTPGAVLSKLKADIEAAPGRAQTKNAKSLNTILRGFLGGAGTLTQRVDALRVDNPEVRPFPFAELRRALQERHAERDDVPVVYL